MKHRPASALAAALAIALAGCGASTPTASLPARGSASPVPSPASPAEPWRMVNLPQPAAVLSAPTLQPGFQCHPCHFLAEDQLFGVAATPGRFIAVGIEEPPAEAIAFSSADGATWTPLAGFTGATGTAAVAVASNATRTVIVGHDTSGATSWASGGGTWAQAPSQPSLLVPYDAGAMTSVVAFGAGFVAGGYRDDPLHVAASAAVWRSDDGLAWRSDDGGGTFAGGRIWGVAGRGGTLVAVGANGDPTYGPAAAWRWTQASGWQRATILPGTLGVMLAVTATSAGFVAVGQNGANDGALAWTSPDGLTWTAVPSQPSLDYYSLPLRMQSVVVGPSGIVAGGWRSDAGKGSAVTWTSTDGVTWQGPTWQISFSGGQITGVAPSGPSVVAVGRTGYPDWNQATIWVSRAQ